MPKDANLENRKGRHSDATAWYGVPASPFTSDALTGARGLRGVLGCAWGGEHPAGDGGLHVAASPFASDAPVPPASRNPRVCIY